jgi:hypothetical protein
MESRAADGKYLIQEHIVAAIQFVGNWDATNPRICWQKQVSSLEILVQLRAWSRVSVTRNMCRFFGRAYSMQEVMRVVRRDIFGTESFINWQ